MISRLLIHLIAAYQRWISPAFPRRCKYEPTCSRYAVQAVRELGPARGAIVAAWRLARCNPLSDGGIDDLEDRRMFRGHGDDCGHDQAPMHPRGPASRSTGVPT